MANDLKSFEEYNVRYYQNMKMHGFGANTTAHLPCPWCAQADFLVVRMIDIKETMSRPTQCKNCGRTGKTVYYHGDIMPPEDAGPTGEITLVGDVGNSGPGYTFEFVQTDGDDAPEWMPLKPRRVQD